jgi:diacylglycerol kinase (ATP)
MDFAIIVNPASGTTSRDTKRDTLAEAAAILGAEIHGLDTTTADDLCECVRWLSGRCDILVIAGGDGTFHDVINAIDLAQTPVAFLPLGTGNALGHALGYRGDLAAIALRIRDGHIHEYDLIDCDHKGYAFMASMGIEGTVVQLCHQYRNEGATGLKTYFMAALDAYFRKYRRVDGRIILDGTVLEVKNLLSLMVVKEPYYGLGMKVVPMARFDDRELHVLCINSGLLRSIMGGLTAFTIGNRIGEYMRGRQLTAHFDRPLPLQIDGNEGWTADTFTFRVLPQALRIIS